MNSTYIYIWQNFSPEIILVAVALLTLIIDLFLPRANNRLGLMIFTAVGSLAAAAAAVQQWVMASDITNLLGQAPDRISLFSNPKLAAEWLFANDGFACFFKILFCFAAFLVLVLSTRFPVEKFRGEFAALLLFAATGLMVMVNSRDLVVLFLGLETASLCMYAMAAWQKHDARSAEAGTKYLLLGSLASACFIYGVSLLFLKFGTTHLSTLMELPKREQPLVLISLLLMLVGFGFKVAAAPFHLWAPDVYQGAPIPLVAFLSTASKAAGFGVLIRVLFCFQGLSDQWLILIWLMSAMSMLLGNLIAIHQNNVKRLLAYSGIAQAGYLLIGVTAIGLSTANSQNALTAIIFYLFLYTVTNIGAFAITGIVAQSTGSEMMSAFAGLRWRAPLLAFSMIILLLSLGGIPLLAGFVGKWFLFLSGVQQEQYVLVLIGTVMSVVSIYYYLLIVKQMYIIPAEEGAPPIRIGFPAGIGLLLIVALTIIIGVYPHWFYAMAQFTAQTLQH